MRKYVLAVRQLIIGSELRNLIQVVDALLKEVCAALLESDVNVKLVQSLRQKCKVKAHQQFESGDKLKETNRRNVVQRVSIELPHPLFGSLHFLTDHLRRACESR